VERGEFRLRVRAESSAVSSAASSRNGICSRMGMVTDLSFVEDFVGFGLGGSSILGITGLDVIVPELRFC